MSPIIDYLLHVVLHSVLNILIGCSCLHLRYPSDSMLNRTRNLVSI